MNFVGWGNSTTLAPQSAPIGPVPSGSDGLIDALLIEQGDLSAVDRFSKFVETIDDAGSLGNRYEALLPATPPGPGQQLAFEVDLDRCSGCKACVAACHSLNGLDEGETWREVGLIVGGMPGLPVLQHVTSSCHHCLDPACLDACPVDAYEKDPITGIVRHLDDQCIGCRYCTLACPYDAPKYQESKGIVRKCDMCADRLREGEPPACVASCPHEAIRITVVNHEEVAERSEAGRFLPTAFDPAHTRPTTSYHSRSPKANDRFEAADAHRLVPDHAHGPLVVMLVLTQVSVGGLALELASRLMLGAGIGPGIIHVMLCLAIGFAGLGASVLHLGRPLYAYRAILGLRHSWLSREVLAFGIFAKLAAGFVAAEWLGWPRLITTGLLAGAVGAGVVGVGCSVMVYHAVRRPFWHGRITARKFFGTSLVTGLAASLAVLGLTGGEHGQMGLVVTVLAIATAAKLRFETIGTFRGNAAEAAVLDRSLLLMFGPLRALSITRWGLGLLGGVVLPLLVVGAAAGGLTGLMIVASILVLPAIVGGELAERALFFSAVVRPKMPGGMAS